MLAVPRPAGAQSPQLIVGELYSGGVRRYDGVTGSPIDTIGAGQVLGAGGVTFGPDGNLYVSSRGSGQILKYNGVTGRL